MRIAQTCGHTCTPHKSRCPPRHDILRHSSPNDSRNCSCKQKKSRKLQHIISLYYFFAERIRCNVSWWKELGSVDLGAFVASQLVVAYVVFHAALVQFVHWFTTCSQFTHRVRGCSTLFSKINRKNMNTLSPLFPAPQKHPYPI